MERIARIDLRAIRRLGGAPRSPRESRPEGNLARHESSFRILPFDKVCDSIFGRRGDIINVSRGLRSAGLKAE